MFQVVWLEEGDRELEETWTASVDATRLRMLDALGTFETELENRAHRFGKSRSGTLRIAFEPPLAILFEVEEHVVYVAHVIRYGK